MMPLKAAILSQRSKPARARAVRPVRPARQVIGRPEQAGAAGSGRSDVAPIGRLLASRPDLIGCNESISAA